jgi:transcriptional regulator GlxA family with amidase domain
MTNVQRFDGDVSRFEPRRPQPSQFRGAPSSADRRMELALTLLVSNHRRSQFSTEELARRVRLSPSRLRELFRKEIGIPPMRYLRLLRLESAKSLLEYSFLSVKEIAAEIGYGDISHFVRDFKRRYNVTPTEARACAKNEHSGQ